LNSKHIISTSWTNTRFYF